MSDAWHWVKKRKREIAAVPLLFINPSPDKAAPPSNAGSAKDPGGSDAASVRLEDSPIEEMRASEAKRELPRQTAKISEKTLARVIDVTPEYFAHHVLISDSIRLGVLPQETKPGTQKITAGLDKEAELEAMRLLARHDLAPSFHNKLPPLEETRYPKLPVDREGAKAEFIAELSDALPVLIRVEIGAEGGENHRWLKRFLTAPDNFFQQFDARLRYSDAKLARQFMSFPKAKYVRNALLALSDEKREALKEAAQNHDDNKVADIILHVSNDILDRRFSEEFFAPLQNFSHAIKNPELIHRVPQQTAYDALQDYGKDGSEKEVARLLRETFTAEQYATYQSFNPFHLKKAMKVIKSLPEDASRDDAFGQAKAALLDAHEAGKRAQGNSSATLRHELDFIMQNAGILFGDGKNPGLLNDPEFQALCDLAEAGNYPSTKQLVELAQAVNERLMTADGKVFLTLGLTAWPNDAEDGLKILSPLMYAMRNQIPVPGEIHSSSALDLRRELGKLNGIARLKHYPGLLPYSTGEILGGIQLFPEPTKEAMKELAKIPSNLDKNGINVFDLKQSQNQPESVRGR